METPIVYAHAIVILPGKRVLLMKSCYSCLCNVDEWTATIEKKLFKTDNPNFIITQAIANTLNINLSLNPQIPKAIIEPLNFISLSKYNRIIFPFVVEIKNAITLKLKTHYRFVAEPFSVLLDNYNKSSYTINTIHVIKEAHLKGVLSYVPIKK